MAPYRDDYTPENEGSLVNVDKKGKPSEKGKSFARESAVQKFLDAEEKAKIFNKDKKKEDRLTAQDLLQEELVQGYVKDLKLKNFDDSPEKFLNEEDLRTYRTWLDNEFRILGGRGPERLESRVPSTIHGFIDGKEIVLFSNGMLSRYGNEKLDEAQAQRMFKNLAALIAGLDKEKKVYQKSVLEGIEKWNKKDEAEALMGELEVNYYGTTYVVIKGQFQGKSLIINNHGNNCHWGSVKFTSKEAKDLFDRFDPLIKRRNYRPIEEYDGS